MRRKKKGKSGRGRNRSAVVPGRRVRQQVEVKVVESAEAADRTVYVAGRLKGLEPEHVVELLIEDVVRPDADSCRAFTKEFRVILSLMGAIPGMDGETRRFLNLGKTHRWKKTDAS
jgi:hypothetical protein